MTCEIASRRWKGYPRSGPEHFLLAFPRSMRPCLAGASPMERCTSLQAVAPVLSMVQRPLLVLPHCRKNKRPRHLVSDAAGSFFQLLPMWVCIPTASSLLNPTRKRMCWPIWRRAFPSADLVPSLVNLFACLWSVPAACSLQPSEPGPWRSRSADGGDRRRPMTLGSRRPRPRDGVSA